MNPFSSHAPALSGPATDALPVTLDAADLAHGAIGLHVETGGTLGLDTVAGGTRSLAVADNPILPLAVRRVRATGTTAQGIHAPVLA